MQNLLSLMEMVPDSLADLYESVEDLIGQETAAHLIKTKRKNGRYSYKSKKPITRIIKKKNGHAQAQVMHLTKKVLQKRYQVKRKFAR